MNREEIKIKAQEIAQAWLMGDEKRLGTDIGSICPAIESLVVKAVNETLEELKNKISVPLTSWDDIFEAIRSLKLKELPNGR